MSDRLIERFETIPCPLCGETRFRVVAPARFPSDITQDFLTHTYRSSSDQTLFEQMVRCRRCGLVYLNPRLRPELIISAYAEGEDSAFVKQDEMRVRTFTKALRRISRKTGLALDHRTATLDIGCAGGAFLRAAKALGLSAIGVEPNRWMGEYARSTHGLDVRSGTLADQTFPTASFDLVTLWDVIEHLSDPSDELRRIHTLLKPNGFLVVNYPDFGSLPAKLLGRKWPFLLSVHLIYYTPSTIRRQLKRCGFEVMDIRRHWQILELGYVIRRAEAYFPWLRFLRSTVEKIGLAKWPITYWIGQTQVIAKPHVKKA